MPHVELVRDSANRDQKVIRRMVQILHASEHQEDPAVAGELAHEALLLGAAHLGEPFVATPWTAEQEGDVAADEAREQRCAA